LFLILSRLMPPIVLSLSSVLTFFSFFFLMFPPTPEIYTLSLHVALPILIGAQGAAAAGVLGPAEHSGFEEGAIDDQLTAALEQIDRKSTRLNSSHGSISYAVFCLKKKKDKKKKRT